MNDLKDLARCRAMESLCRQSAVFHPLESWRLLAEAEMWHHKAEEAVVRNDAPPSGAPKRAESPGDLGDASRPLAG